MILDWSLAARASCEQGSRPGGFQIVFISGGDGDSMPASSECRFPPPILFMFNVLPSTAVSVCMTKTVRNSVLV
jgi:hypothetical protein